MVCNIVGGVIGDPCGAAPALVLVPSCSMAPSLIVDLFHRRFQLILISAKRCRSLMRLATDFINSAWGMLSNETVP